MFNMEKLRTIEMHRGDRSYTDILDGFEFRLISVQIFDLQLHQYMRAPI